MKAFLIAVVLHLGGSAPWLAERAGAQVVPWQTDDSCLCLYQNYYRPLCTQCFWYNPDSVMVDTCALNVWVFDTTDLPLYAKRWYGILLDSDYFHFPAAPLDTIIQTTWQQLDTIYDTLRDEFDSLQRQYGPFVLRKFYPNETTGVLSCDYHMGFDSLLEVDAVLNTLDGLFTRGAEFVGNPDAFYDTVADIATEGHRTNPSVFPNPSRSEAWIFGCNEPVSDAIVMDVLGRVVRRLTISPPSTEFNIDLAGLRPGIYTISDNGSLVIRVILQP